jgi:hypothetical protein
MIETRKDFLESTASAVVISRDLANDLFRSTKNPKLKELITDKPSVVIVGDLKSQLTTRLEQLSSQAEFIRSKRTSKGGRHKLPEPTEKELEKWNSDPTKYKKELLTYKNRLWKRNERNRRKSTEII